MKGRVIDVVAITMENTFFRREVYTAEHSQLVVMSLKPQEDISMEVHRVDQILVIVAGSGIALFDGQVSPFKAGDCVYVPAGVRHAITNTSFDQHLKLYTVYAPAQHARGTVQKTKSADED